MKPRMPRGKLFPRKAVNLPRSISPPLSTYYSAETPNPLSQIPRPLASFNRSALSSAAELKETKQHAIEVNGAFSYFPRHRKITPTKFCFPNGPRVLSPE